MASISSMVVFTHLKGFPFTPFQGVFHLVTVIETWEGGKGVDPGSARA